MEIGFQVDSFFSFYGMAQVAEVLVALKRLSEDDLRVLAETTKKCVAESKKRKIEEDDSSTFPLDGKASAMKVQQTFPVILITSEDLANLKESGNPNLIINSLTHGKESDEKISLLCVNQEIDQGIIVQNVVFNDIPDLPMFSTSVGEEVVFIYCRSSFEQEFVNGGALNSFTNPAEARINFPKSIPLSKGRFFVITNRGNIFSGYLHKEYCWPLLDLHPQFVDPQGQAIESFQINYGNSLEDDEFCFVPQIFVDLISVSTQLFEVPSNFPHEGGKRHPAEYDLKHKFKVLCRQYNKMRQGQDLTIKDLSNQLGVLGEELEVQVGQKMEMEKLLFESKAMLQDFWATQQADVVLQSFILMERWAQSNEPTILDDLKDLKVFGKSVVKLFQSQASVIDLLHTEVQRRETESFLKEEVTTEQISRLQEELSETKEELAQSREELSQTKEELSQSRDELSQTKEELSQTKEELSQTKDTQLQEKIAQLQANFNRLEQELSYSKEELSTSKEELHRSKKELANSKEELSKMKSKVFHGKEEKKSWFWN